VHNASESGGRVRWPQMAELQSQVDAAKHEKEAAELKLMTQSVQLSCIDNSKLELDMTLARKNSELDACRQKSDTLHASVQKLEAELADLRAASQLQLDTCRRACDDLVAAKDADLKGLQMKVDQLQRLLNKQVRINGRLQSLDSFQSF